MLRAIVYTESGRRNWKHLARGSKAQLGLTAALQEFSRDLERLMNDMAGMCNSEDFEVTH